MSSISGATMYALFGSLNDLEWENGTPGTVACIVCVIATGCGKIRAPQSHGVRSHVFH